MPSTACASTTAATPNAMAADAGSKKRGRRDSTFPSTGLAADNSSNHPGSSKQTNAKKQKQEVNAASGSGSSFSGAAANAKSAAAKKKESLQLQCGQQQANLLPGGGEFEGDEQEESEDDVHPIALLPQLADQFQKSNGNAGKQGGTVKFTAADIKELRSNGFTTVDSLHFPPMRKLLLVQTYSRTEIDVRLSFRKKDPRRFW
jgi:hypothetical protein